MIRVVIFVVCMILWLLGGGYIVYSWPGGASPLHYGGHLLPWICVAILGYEQYGGPAPPPR